MRNQKHLATVPRLQSTHKTLPNRTPQRSNWQALLLPRREARIMGTDTNQQNGLFLPYPLLGMILTLVLALGGGIVGLFIQVNSLQTTLLLRDADHKEALKRQETVNELQEQYIRDIREKQAEMRSDVNLLLNNKKRGG